MSGRMNEKHDITSQPSIFRRRSFLTGTAVAGISLATGGVTGCSGSSDDAQSQTKRKIQKPSDNFRKKGFPIVKKPVSVKFMTMKPPATAKHYNKVLVWQKYQKMTNIKVEWGLVPGDSIEEKRNLALSGGDYPEVFNAMGFSNRDLQKYGDEGVFLNLKDLIENYMPNLRRIMRDRPSVRKAMTFGDGSIYGLPLVIGPEFDGFRIEYTPWIRGDWLDRFDLDVPKTTGEFYDYLKNVKSRPPNGKSDTVPYGSSHQTGFLYSALTGAFGVGNRGSGGYVDVEPDETDKVRFFPTSDGYKALLEYLHRLYSEGLILQNIFSIDEAKAMQAIKKGTYGSTVEIAPDFQFGGKAKKFVPMGALKGPEGHHKYNNMFPSVVGINYFVISDKCKHPAELARWIDYFYSDEGCKLYFLGVEGRVMRKQGTVSSTLIR